MLPTTAMMAKDLNTETRITYFLLYEPPQKVKTNPEKPTSVKVGLKKFTSMLIRMEVFILIISG